MLRLAAIACFLLLAPTARANAAAIVGKPAPAFDAVDVDGKLVQLDAFKGKYVVLEWVNFGCPFVGKHYGSGNMQELQKKFSERGVVWLSICSSAPGKQGHVTGDEAKELIAEKEAAPTRFLLDPKGIVGKLYGAKTTPHMFVINPKGILVYNGAIDDRPSTKRADIKDAKNYLTAALESSLAGNKVEIAATQPYGCSVKY
ncbi:MAG TPA: thioredoxin family protein [Candidatus Eisenbacteria bacterium]|nr:thioredoxin family protein [Candidatus Eisenbacteria bacterium]